MGRPRSRVPQYREHTQSGQARVVWTDAHGTYHDRLLPGPFNSEESRTAYGRLLLELQVAPAGGNIPPHQRSDLTMVEVLAAYLDHAERHYRGPDGIHTSEFREHKLVIKAMRVMYGESPAAEFGPLALKAVRQSWVAAGLSRGEVNRRTRIAKHIIKWAASEELVFGAVWQSLGAVAGLQKGRTAARETKPVGPVADAVVDATLPHLGRYVAGLVEFQRLTGCRPWEACLVRRCDIDQSAEAWVYTPKRHKNEHRGKLRPIAVGPKAQTLLTGFFTDNPNDYLFSPKRAVEELHARRSAERETPRFKSHMDRNKKKRTKRPKRPTADHYRNTSYSHAVARACEAAGVKPWTPNQLRHTFATKVRKAHGLEAAQVLLGHAKADVTQIYAEKNQSLAAKVAAEMG